MTEPKSLNQKVKYNKMLCLVVCKYRLSCRNQRSKDAIFQMTKVVGIDLKKMYKQYYDIMKHQSSTCIYQIQLKERHPKSKCYQSASYTQSKPSVSNPASQLNYTSHKIDMRPLQVSINRRISQCKRRIIRILSDKIIVLSYIRVF